LDATIQLEPVSLPEVSVAAPKHRKDRADSARRFQDLLAQLTTVRRGLLERTQEAERLHTALTAKDRELAQFRLERENLPTLAARAREKGREMFPDFDVITGPVQLDQRTFEALLTSALGPQLFYAMGLGLRIIAAKIEKQSYDSRVEYYRQQHEQHFKGAF
jgi:hypothetical protein